MKRKTGFKVVVAVVTASVVQLGSMSSLALDYGDLAKINEATKMISQAQELSQAYQLADGDINEHVETAEPVADGSGKFVVPFTADGELTEWATKALTAQTTAAVAGKASDKAVDALAAKVPFGSAFSGGFKKKGKSAAAATAIGGWDSIRASSDRSFDNLGDYAVYLHTNYATHPDYTKALAASLALYPKLEKNYKKSVTKAYKAAAKRADEASAETAAATEGAAEAAEALTGQ